jgi:hypothetical protein
VTTINGFFFFGGGHGSRIELQEKLKERGYDAR